jgi:aryl-alcohol dehydrogenase-like predicted oxidoreductase
MTLIDRTDLDVFPLCLGGNVFGWTAGEAQSFAVLDAYAEAGGNFVDTADVYSAWAPGNPGGVSESIIGRWLAARGNRDRVVIATKVGQAPGLAGLSAGTIERAAEASLRRLGVDHIDLYYAHIDDPGVPLHETLTALDSLVRQGKVRYLAASNHSAPRLAEALALADESGLTRYVALQAHFNLVDSRDYPGELVDLLEAERLASLPYLGLANGFLTGKYRPGRPPAGSVRAEKATKYLTERGLAALAVVEEVAAVRETAPAAVALAWLLAQPRVVSPIASARTPGQLADLLASVELKLTGEELARLDVVAG